MPRDPNNWSSDELRHRFEAFSARFAEKARPTPAGGPAAAPADDYWKSLQDLFTRDVTVRDFRDLVGRDSEDTWRFFTREIDFSGLEQKPWYQRYPAAAWKIFLALAYRLSPARRVIFAASVILLFVAWLKFLVTHADLSDGRIALAMGDVAGKGMPAALLMALLQGSLRTLITAGFRGAELVRTLNDHLCANIPPNRLVTLFYAELDPARGEFHYVNAGHNAPFLLRSSGAARLGTTGVALGVVPGSAFDER